MVCKRSSTIDHEDYLTELNTVKPPNNEQVGAGGPLFGGVFYWEALP